MYIQCNEIRLEIIMLKSVLFIKKSISYYNKFSQQYNHLRISTITTKCDHLYWNRRNL